MLRSYILCSPGLVDTKMQSINDNLKELARRRRALHLNDQINTYNNVARAAKDVGQWLHKRAVTC